MSRTAAKGVDSLEDVNDGGAELSEGAVVATEPSASLSVLRLVEVCPSSSKLRFPVCANSFEISGAFIWAGGSYPGAHLISPRQQPSHLERFAFGLTLSRQGICCPVHSTHFGRRWSHSPRLSSRRRINQAPTGRKGAGMRSRSLFCWLFKNSSASIGGAIGGMIRCE